MNLLRFSEGPILELGDFGVHRYVEHWAKLTPEATAVVHGNRTMDYARVNSRANAVARQFRTAGVEPGDRIAFLLPRSIELVLVQLAAAKCGASYVPLDHDAPQERQRYVLRDCGARLLVTASRLVLPSVDDIERTFVNEWAPNDEGDLGEPGSADAEAYVMYTSGSTGRPKGVVVAHRGIARLVVNGNGFADFSPGDRIAFASNEGFDAATLEVWGALVNGACLVVVDRSSLLNEKQFVALLHEQRINVLWLTAGLLSRYAYVPGAFSNLRYLIAGGDVLDPGIATRILQNGGPQHFLNGYGPTETTVFALVHEVTRDCAKTGAIPIGRPIANTRAYIVDECLAPLDPGVAGELCIGGAGVALGYLNDAQMSAQKFIQSPFVEGDVLYKTGDIARYRDDGVVEFLGRRDSQIKVRGFRVELRDIEACMRDCTGVREVVVTAPESGGGQRRITAYVLPDFGAQPEVRAMHAHAAAQLPAYMVPSAYVCLEQFPLKSSGKIDRAALPMPQRGDFPTENVYEPPIGDAEVAIAAIWRNILRVEPIGRNDNFFELGGDSFDAIHLSMLLENEGYDAEPADVYGYPTLEALTRYARERFERRHRERAAPQAVLHDIRPRGDRPPLFMIHDFSGTYSYALNAAPNIATSVPIYAVPGVPLGEPQLDTIEAIARRAVTAIRTMYPTGPYRVAGFSFGGLVAYEVAVHLIAAGQPVDFVGLLDTYHPAEMRRIWDTQVLGTPQRELADWVRQFQDHPVLNELAQRADTSQLEELIGTCKMNRLLPEWFYAYTSEEAGEFFVRMAAYRRAAMAYHPAVLSAPLHFFAAEVRDENVDEFLGWRNIRGLDIVRIGIPGTHSDFVTNRAPDVGDAIDRALATLEASASGVRSGS